MHTVILVACNFQVIFETGTGNDWGYTWGDVVLFYDCFGL